MTHFKPFNLLAALVILSITFLTIQSCAPGGAQDKNSSSDKKQTTQSDDNNGNDSDAKSSSSDDKKSGKHTQKLFIIERSKNANIVRYDAQITEKGKLNADKPVIAYWILKADKGERAELSGLQKKFAYGFSTKKASSGEGYIMEMVPLPKRKLRIRMKEKKARAELKIDGKRAVLKKIYVDSKPGWVKPDVQYVKLFGTDVETGKERTEKINP